MSDAERIRNGLKKFPSLSAKELAKKLKVDLQRVYTIKWQESKKAKADMKAAASNVGPKAELDGSGWQSVSVLSPEEVEAIWNEKNHPEDTDAINPEHYKIGGIDTIDFIEAKGLGFHLGNVVKYVSRSDFKGKRIEDLKKALWYLNRAIEQGEK